MGTKSLTAIAVAGVALVASAVPAAHADVVGNCQLRVPASVRVSTPYQHISPSVSGTCAGYANSLYALWDLYSAAGWEDYVDFDYALTGSWDVYDDVRLGRWTWRPGGALEEATGNEFTQNAPATEIRVGSWTRMTASRSGSMVNLWVNGNRYSTMYDKPIPWQTTATIQYRNVGSSSWQTLTSRSVSGGFTFRASAPVTRDYRVVYAGSPTIWGSTSSVVRA